MSPPPAAPTRNRSRMVGAILVLLGAILGAVSLVTAWWMATVTASGSGLSISSSEYWNPFGPTCSGGVSCSGSYSQLSSAMGNLFDAVIGLIVVAVILGFLSFIILLMSGMGRMSSPRAGKAGLGLAALAGLLFLITPIVFLALEPGAWPSSASGSFCPSGSNPGSSFFGSCSGNSGGVSESVTWGGGLGWILAFVAFALILIGVILTFRARGKSMAPAAASAMTSASSGTWSPASGSSDARTATPESGGEYVYGSTPPAGAKAAGSGYCTACRTQNPPGTARCARCGAQLA